MKNDEPYETLVTCPACDGYGTDDDENECELCVGGGEVPPEVCAEFIEPWDKGE